MSSKRIIHSILYCKPISAADRNRHIVCSVKHKYLARAVGNRISLLHIQRVDILDSLQVVDCYIVSNILVNSQGLCAVLSRERNRHGFSVVAHTLKSDRTGLGF